MFLILAGLVDAKISQTMPVQLGLLVSGLGQAFFEFETKNGTSLTKSLNLWQCMSQHLAEAKDFDSKKYPVLEAVRAACTRFEDQLVDQARDFIKDAVQKHADLKAAGAYVTKTLGKTPDSVSKLVHTLVACANAHPECLNMTDLPMERDQLQKFLPFFTKFLTMDSVFMKEVAGETADKISKFCDLFATTLTAWTTKKRSELDGFISNLEKYRRAGLCPIVISGGLSP